MHEVAKKLSAHFLEKNVIQGWASITESLDQGYNSSYIYDFLFRDAMYHIGELWEKNEITVADEHLATGVSDLLLSKYHLEKKERNISDKGILPITNTGRAMFFCVEGEDHYLGLKMASSLFEEFGWDVYDLGSNLPLEYAEYSIKKWQPEVICISITIRHLLPKLKDTIKRLAAIHPEATIIVGSRLHDEAAFRSCCTEETIIAKDAAFLYQWLNHYQNEASFVKKGVLS
ncbi:cobalamin B12-binding domain-containing protein [Bacillus tianshenii]|uniref:cobalamin B12-binding domain-containing protein n=1 Tax=Sutcliffiella tianshenii TaxID=1463404 RepID=UPI001CD6B69E|nr:cobalamin B12-binding domain-containing protein [Bacillus tianshenii]MCA1319309.1 cobalamin B12-binding domain-containing protein [Bacillus tianshenii]